MARSASDLFFAAEYAYLVAERPFMRVSSSHVIFGMDTSLEQSRYLAEAQ